MRHRRDYIENSIFYGYLPATNQRSDKYTYPGKAQFILVGDGPLSQNLKETLPDNVAFTGYLKGRELSILYASADVFVFPSGTETLGNVVLEAMASGLPVVTVNSGGVKENVIHNYNGFMCKSRDTASFTGGIAKFIEDEGLIAAMGKNARQYTHKNLEQRVRPAYIRLL